jgi:hypothetical protein
VVTTSNGEVVYDVTELRAQDTNRLDFDIPVEHLKPGDFQVSVKRSGETSVAGTFYFRVQ